MWVHDSSTPVPSLSTQLYHRYHACSFEALQSFCKQFAALKAGPLARSVAHYVLLPQAWGLADPSKPQLPPPASPAVDAGATVPVTPSASASDETGLPAFAVSRSMIAASCGIGGNACGRIGPDVDLFLEQAVIAASRGLIPLASRCVTFRLYQLLMSQ